MNNNVNGSTLTEEQLLSMPAADYMNVAQKDYFKILLQSMQEKLKQEINDSRKDMHAPGDVGDSLDLAANTEMLQLSLRTTERKTKLLHKVEESLISIETGNYGYCVETGKAIGLERLLARPTATLSINSKEQQEFHERTEGVSEIGVEKEEGNE